MDQIEWNLEETLSENDDRYDDILVGTSNDYDEYSDKRKEYYGKCPTCNRYNTAYSWCQTCDTQLLTQGWTSGNKTIDKLIKNKQLKATEYDNKYYLQWIPYDELKDIEKISEGGFSTIRKAAWTNGEKYIDYDKKKKTSKDMIVALKKLHNSQNISDEFLNEVNNLLLLILLLSCFLILNEIHYLLLNKKYIISSKIILNFIKIVI